MEPFGRPDSPDYQAVEGYFLRLALRLRRLAGLQWIVLTATLAGVVLLLGRGVEALKHLFPWAPPIYASLGALLGLGLLVLLVRWSRSRLRPEKLAIEIEQQYPELRNNAISSLQLEAQAAAEHGHVSASLIRALQNETRRQLEAIDAHAVASSQPLKRLALVLAAVLVAVLGVQFLLPDTLSLAARNLFHPLASMPPRHFTITVEPGNHQIATGQSLKVAAQAHDRFPSRMELVLRFADGSSKNIAMRAAPSQGRFEHTVRQVQESFRYLARSGISSSDEHEIVAVAPPHLGNVRVSYVFPEYTGLPPKSATPSGHLQALKGSEVTVRFDADKELQRGKLVFDDGSEVALDIGSDWSAAGTFILTRSGSYRAVVSDQLGFENPEPVTYGMKAVPDAYPRVELLMPATALIVDEGDTITLVYQARDDFGIRSVALVYQGAGSDSQRIDIETLRERKTLRKDTFNWSLAGLPIKPGEDITYFIEVEDNDVISGPKKGVSKTFRLTLRSKQEVHENVAQLQEEITNELLDALADQLEVAADTDEMAQELSETGSLQDDRFGALVERDRQMQQNMDRLLSKVQQAQRQIQEDSLNNYGAYLDMNMLRENLQYLRNNLQSRASQALQEAARNPNPAERQNRPPFRSRQPSADSQQRAQAMRLLQAQQERVTSELERLSTFTEQMQQRQRMNDIANLGQRLTSTQNRLMDQMDNLQEGMDDAARRALENELKQAQELMRQMMQALSKLPTQMPDEFLNQANLQNLPMNDIMQAMNEVRRKLAEGDLEGARQALERMLQQMSQMLAMLMNAQRMAEQSAMGGMQNSAQRSSSEMQEIIKEQSTLLQNTQAIDKVLEARLVEAQKAAFARLMPDLQARLQALEATNRNTCRLNAVNPRLRNWSFDQFNTVDKALKSMREALNDRRMADFTAGGNEALEEFEELAQALEIQRDDPLIADQAKHLQARVVDAQETLRSTLGAVEDLQIDVRSLATDKERHALNDLATRQNVLRDRTGRFHERLSELAKLLPFLPQEVVEKIGESIPFMQEAAKELTQYQSRQAVIQETEALNRLMQSQQSLQQSLQQMAQRGAMGGMAIPLIMAGRPQPLLPGMPPMQPGQFQDGRMGVNRENFRLPKREEYQVPKIFREEIMEALKEGMIEEYREQVEQYYQNLVE